MKNASPVLEARHRGVIAQAIRDVCHHNEWMLQALNVRTDHVHIVLSREAPPEKAINFLKAWSTRRLREAGVDGIRGEAMGEAREYSLFVGTSRTL
jgi:REP element-mobilizing transposase RayT